MKTKIQLGKLTVEDVEKANRPTVIVRGKEAIATAFIKASEKVKSSKEAYEDQRDVITFEAEEIQKQMADLDREHPENVKFLTKNGKSAMAVTTYSSVAVPKDIISEVREHLPESVQEQLVVEEHSITLKGELAKNAMAYFNGEVPTMELDGDIRLDKNFSESRTVKTVKEAHLVVKKVQDKLPECKDLLAKLSKITEPGMTVKVQ